MAVHKHTCHKAKTDPTYSREWSGVSGAPHCKAHDPCCPVCGEVLHHEGGSHYCPGCDDYKGRPTGCTYD